MKILRVVSSIDPRYGGVVEAMRSTTLALQRLGHSVEIVTIDEKNAPFLADFPAPVHAVGRGLLRYRYTPRLKQWIAANGARYDAGIIEGLWNHETIGGHQGMRAVNLPYVIFPHGMMDPWFRSQYPLKHLVKQLFWWALQGWVLRDAAAVAFTCEEEKRLARTVFSGPKYIEEVVSLGISSAPRLSIEQSREFRNQVPTLGSSPYLLFMSRIHPKKGCDLLIRAFAEMAKMESDTHLVIAGPDQVGWQTELFELARSEGVADRIHWPGMLEGAVKWSAIQGCDAFVLPSHQENFGFVVAEAMACSKAVLTTDKVNIWREVKASGGGLIETDSQDGILRLLRQWHELPPDEKQSMSGKAREGFLTYFHIDSAVREMERLLDRVKRKAAA